MSSCPKLTIDLTQSGSNEKSSMQTLNFITGQSGVANNSFTSGPVRTINVLIIKKIDDKTKGELGDGNSIGIIALSNDLEKSLQKTDIKKPLDVVQSIYKCPNCEQTYKTRKILNKHILVAHRGVRGYKCHICDKSYILQDYLSVHLTHHEKDRMFKCNDCGLTFTRQFHLTNHKRSKHNMEGPSVCEYCGKFFKTKGGLISHTYIHHSKDSSACVCDICGKSFISKTYLTNHLTTHSNLNLVCDICNKTYPHKRALRSHKNLIHSDEGKRHFCILCNKQFKHSMSLKKHIQLKHEDREKPKCYVCNATFSQKTALQTHMKIIHSGLTPHVCKHCKQEFRWKQTCEKHEKKCSEDQKEKEEKSESLSE